MSHPTYTPKDPAEVGAYGLDFAARLDADETITGAVWTSEAITVGVADSSPVALSGGTITGSIVAKTVTGGTGGMAYKLRAEITTSATRTLVGCGILPVAEC